MSKHWRPQNNRSSGWLSPEAYDALSPAEKRALWFQRQEQKLQRRSRPTPARYRKGHFARQRLYWGIGSFVAIPFLFAVLSPMLGTSTPAPVASSSQIEWGTVQAVPTRTPDAADVAWERRAQESDAAAASSPAMPAVRASFGYCYTGGGTNCVVDGDTFWIGGQKVRIAGIDAPETHPPRCDYEARLGNEATEKLHALLNSGAVTMTSIDRDRDVYGRLLRNVAVNGADVGEAMVSAGVAREYGRGRRSWC